MIQGEVSFIQAVRDYFSDRKMEISEFKALSMEDKVELRELLIAEGYDVAPLATMPPQQA
jgi:maleate cis-trans isomerase